MMRHVLHLVVAVLGAGLVVVASAAAVFALWGGATNRVGPREVVTWLVCVLVLWVVLELKHRSMRRIEGDQPREDPSRVDRRVG